KLSSWQEEDMFEMKQGAPAELWQALVREAAGRAGHPLDESREAYLVFVLLRYQGDAQLLAHTHALDWFRAQEQVGRLRADALRDVGDRCLLVAGLFPGLAARRRVSVDYFVELGRGAYRGVGEASRAAYGARFGPLAGACHCARERADVRRAAPVPDHGAAGRSRVLPFPCTAMSQREWVAAALRKIVADFNRSADTHLIPMPLPGYPGIDVYLKDESSP